MIIALQGTVLGLLIGVFFGWALVLAMKDQGLTVFSLPVLGLPVLGLLIVVVLAGVAGVVAAILPGRRAAKLNILHAIVSEQQGSRYGRAAGRGRWLRRREITQKAASEAVPAPAISSTIPSSPRGSSSA